MPVDKLQSGEGEASFDLGAVHREAVQALNRRDYESTHRLCLEILKREPAFADAYFLLGMIALEHDQAAKACELIDRALARDARNAEYLAQRARCSVLLGENAAALRAARAGLELAPRDALTLSTIGVALTKVGDHERALDALRRAVERQPENSQFHFNLGSAQQFLGDFSAAAASYERAIALAPDFHRAHWALSEVRHATRDGNHVPRLRQLLDSANLDADATLYLGHALAKEYEELGLHADAFATWQRAKALKRQERRASMALRESLFKAIETLCSAEFLAARERGYESSEPIFVVGLPRSGTTLVERILAAHRDVYAAGELDEFGSALMRALGVPAVGRQGMSAAIVRRAVALDFARLGEDYLAATRPRTGHTKHFVDKMPANAIYAGFIHRALPNARIVCLRRNALDVCLSNYRQLFSVDAPYHDYTYDLLDTGRYYLMFDRLMQHWQRVLPTRFMVVDYEALVENTEREARRLLEYCGLSWEANVLDFHAGTTAIATASAVQARQPIYRTSVGRWRSYARELEPLMELLARNGVVYE